MKKRLLIFLGTLAVVLIPLGSVSAMSVALCEDDTIECKIQNCESSNALAEWDAMGSGIEPNFKDCSRYQKQHRSQQNEKYLYAGAGAFAGISAVATMFLLPRIVKTRTGKKK